jgi:hypothetical protein
VDGSKDSLRLDAIERDLREVRGALTQIVTLLERVTNLGRVVEDHETRLRTVEKHQPSLLEMRSWIIAGIAAGGSGLVSYLISTLGAR